MGVFFAFLALACWGVGDFLIQKSARKFGDWSTLFFITLIGTIVLLPLVFNQLPTIFSGWQFWLLLLISCVMTFAALLDFEALRVGKISVVEPIYALEVPITTILAAVLIREFVSWEQLALIVVLLVGIFLIANKSLERLKKFRWEKGVWLALLATMAMGLVNFLFGLGARETDPLVVNWFICLAILLVTTAYLLGKHELIGAVRSFKAEPALIVGVGLIDNLAWVAFAFSALYIPIAIAISISESYIALAACLGIVINKEKLKKHQWLGLVLSVVAVVVLALITE